MSRAVRTLAAIAGTYLTLAAVAAGVAVIRGERWARRFPA